MAETIIKLNRISKTYIIGTRKNASKAQKAIQKLHKSYEDECEKEDLKCKKDTEDLLEKAQELFSKEKYEESYKTVTGKTLKSRPKDRGAVVHALDNVTLEIKKGDLVAIMGPSGSGKSTLLNMLGLLDSPTAGLIYLKGMNVTGIKSKKLPEIRSNDLGFVFQSFNLIPSLTALENVMLPLKYAGIKPQKRKEMAKKALESVGLGDRLDHTPNELSGGQGQRVAIARSVVNNPAIIFGDELTGELDTKMTKEVMGLIQNLNSKGQTFIIVTHNPEVAKMCKRTIHMLDGKVDKDHTNGKK
ncbi:MAG: ABC transporter ATP-binding protein [Patescibacteria group bacterium]|jgi:putative ABC transport system ATP-binding protein|nr:ABC transporter ATP-binding protein [Patescibacteria group bacterium]